MKTWLAFRSIFKIFQKMEKLRLNTEKNRWVGNPVIAVMNCKIVSTWFGIATNLIIISVLIQIKVGGSTWHNIIQRRK
jgi:hypothetical protein